jgi:hypothetical protein
LVILALFQVLLYAWRCIPFLQIMNLDRPRLAHRYICKSHEHFNKSHVFIAVELRPCDYFGKIRTKNQATRPDNVSTEFLTDYQQNRQPVCNRYPDHELRSFYSPHDIIIMSHPDIVRLHGVSRQATEQNILFTAVSAGLFYCLRFLLDG